MITVKTQATIAGISELRNKSEQVLKNLKDHPVILERHNHPVAVLIDYKKYQILEEMIDFAEDYVLGLMAQKRDKQAKAGDVVDIDQW
ncbi:MAG: type II toxin-antitoxin system Phd/YefM family antitoxin [Chlamydiae bacterium]|nr:type II toxin-antitoxin system Phd/YefM family antitoxin [Chlamydiota bacterium]MBI3266366.1 type II toxin-antitoxin system Phd/YefM family antitoxin [Chlamydiota bacterium]